MAESITGTLEKIIYHNDDNGFTVAVVARDEFASDTFTFSFHEVAEGTTYRFTGEWKVHQRYGKQFAATEVIEVLPENVIDIETYLASRFVDGIGEATARKIVAEFGTDTFDIMDNKIERLCEVEGIGEKKLEKIKEIWEEQKASREVVIFLQKLGVPAFLTSKIIKHYGNKTTEIVTKNPYRLIDDFHGVGFLTADKIAQNMGIEHDSGWRIEAAVVQCLKEAGNDGHLYLPENILLRKVIDYVSVEPEKIKYAVTSLEDDGKVYIETTGDNEKIIFHAIAYYQENIIVQNLNRLSELKNSFPVKDIKKLTEIIFRNLQFEPAPEQLQAIEDAVNHNLMIITGGPGTGKTTIINSILKLYSNFKKTVLLAAPTGRAAKKMSEATGIEAKTIHRLLEYKPMDGFFAKDEDDRLEADLIIIDETSMIDNALFFNLVKAVPTGCALILVGDVDQLPSVGPGNILKDLIDSNTIHTVRLTKIFRQAEESKIIINAHAINNGKVPELTNEKNTDFYFIRTQMPETVTERIVQMVSEDIPSAFGLDPINEIQVLSPMYKGLTGVLNLNEQLQMALNPAGKEIGKGNPSFRIFDKVMQMKNNYEKEVFNGDVGRISSFDLKDKKVNISFDDKMVQYELSEMDEISLAYAISVHKSQGSEYPCIIMPVVREHGIMLQRKLLYTALTRAKNIVVLIGNEQAVSIAVNNNKSNKRFTRLSERLIDLM